jgi:acetoin utilization deacetylase AcuC-like enzyme
MTSAYITHPACLLHEMGEVHPERPARIRAIEERLEASGLLAQMTRFESPAADDADLFAIHAPEYVSAVRAAAPKAGRVRLDPDTSMNPASLTAALRAAGAAKLACDLVIKGETKTAFLNIRPPGHHAEYDKPMGFCIFNNAALAARRALETHKLNRVLIVDFDVHHGNGTEDIFKNDDRVMLCSSFQHPFYPYSPLSRTGTNPNILKSPLLAGTGGDELKKLVEESWRPAWETFRPEFVVVSAGFDAHEADPIGGLRWTEADFAWITGEIVALANQFAAGKIVSCLEGGYDLGALAASASAHAGVLCR